MKRLGVCLTFSGMLIAGFAGCHSPTKQEQIKAAHDALISEAVAVQQCEANYGYVSNRCASQRADYDRDLAAFRAQYGR